MSIFARFVRTEFVSPYWIQGRGTSKAKKDLMIQVLNKKSRNTVACVCKSSSSRDCHLFAFPGFKWLSHNAFVPLEWHSIVIGTSATSISDSFPFLSRHGQRQKFWFSPGRNKQGFEYVLGAIDLLEISFVSQIVGIFEFLVEPSCLAFVHKIAMEFDRGLSCQ